MGDLAHSYVEGNYHSHTHTHAHSLRRDSGHVVYAEYVYIIGDANNIVCIM